MLPGLGIAFFIVGSVTASKLPGGCTADGYYILPSDSKNFARLMMPDDDDDKLLIYINPWGQLIT